MKILLRHQLISTNSSWIKYIEAKTSVPRIKQKKFQTIQNCREKKQTNVKCVNLCWKIYDPSPSLWFISRWWKCKAPRHCTVNLDLFLIESRTAAHVDKSTRTVASVHPPCPHTQIQLRTSWLLPGRYKTQNMPPTKDVSKLINENQINPVQKKSTKETKKIKKAHFLNNIPSHT